MRFRLREVFVDQDFNYPKGSVGHRMTREVPVMRIGQSVAEVYQAIRRKIPKYKEIHFIYITDENNRLLGTLTLKELFHLAPETEIGSALEKKQLHVARPQAHQESAANLALRHNLRVVPVVDQDGRFLGVLTESAILSILHEEYRKDILRMSGIHPAHAVVDNIFEIPLWKAVQHRLPWLLIGLVGGIVTAHFVGFFEKTIEKNLILTSFIPLVVYMSDAVGNQMEAFVIRDFAISQTLKFSRYFLRQLAIVLAIALIISVAMVGLGYFLYRDWAISGVLGISLVLAILSSVFTGLIIPFVFRRAKVDPANASGPIATIIQDFLSVIIYFGIASWVLGSN